MTMAGTGHGPVDGEDGMGHEDAGQRLSLMIAESGPRVEVGLGVG